MGRGSKLGIRCEEEFRRSSQQFATRRRTNEHLILSTITPFHRKSRHGRIEVDDVIVREGVDEEYIERRLVIAMTGRVLVTTSKAAVEICRRRHAILDEGAQHPPAHHPLVDASCPPDVDGVGAAHRRVDGGRLADGQVTEHAFVGDGEARVTGVVVREDSVRVDGAADELREVSGVETNGGVHPEDGAVLSQHILHVQMMTLEHIKQQRPNKYAVCVPENIYMYDSEGKGMHRLALKAPCC